jgi:hypothetical protein
MSLDDIELPGWLVTDLYKDTLIGSNKTIAHEEVLTDKPSYEFLGNNKKHVIIIVNNGNAVFLSDQHLGLITRMLDACKMSLDDVAILNLASAHLQLVKFKQQFQPEILILFGTDPGSLGLNMHLPMFQIQSFEGCQLILVPALDQLTGESESSKVLKSKLWFCFKALFGLK